MSFRLRSDAEKWFGDLYPGDIQLKFDIYYFCLMAGFTAGRTSKLTSSDKPAFVDDFPQDYRLQQNLLLAGLIDADLRSTLARQVTARDKTEVHNAVSRLLTATGTTTHLSNAGAALMNEYASGGFDVLVEEIGDKPRKLATFLRTFAKVISTLEERKQKDEAAMTG